MAFLIGTDPGLRQTRTPSTDNFTHGVGFTANSSTTIVLSQDPGNENHLDINFDGIEQHRDTYTVSGTTVTFDAVIPTGVVNIQATYAVTVASLTVPDSSVSTAKIVDASVTTSKILDASVTTSKILDANITTSKIQDNAVSLDKMAHGLDGNLITFDANGAPSFVSTGSSAQVLTSAGAGAPPVFADAAGGAWSVLSSGTFSGVSQLIITSLSKTTQVVLSGVTVATNNAVIHFTYSNDGGSSFETSGYYQGMRHQKSDGGQDDLVNANAAFHRTSAGMGNASGRVAAIDVTIYNPQDSGTYTASRINTQHVDDSSVSMHYFGGAMYAVAEAVNAVRFFPTSGNMTGTYTVIQLN